MIVILIKPQHRALMLVIVVALFMTPYCFKKGVAIVFPYLCGIVSPPYSLVTFASKMSVFVLTAGKGSRSRC